MITRDILKTHSVSTLRQEIAKTNIRGYTKMKKNELIDLMMRTPHRFAHITAKEKVPRKTRTKTVPKPTPAVVLKNITSTPALLQIKQKPTPAVVVKKSSTPALLPNLTPAEKKIMKLQVKFVNDFSPSKIDEIKTLQNVESFKEKYTKAREELNDLIKKLDDPVAYLKKIPSELGKRYIKTKKDGFAGIKIKEIRLKRQQKQK